MQAASGGGGAASWRVAWRAGPGPWRRRRSTQGVCDLLSIARGQQGAGGSRRLAKTLARTCHAGPALSANSSLFMAAYPAAMGHGGCARLLAARLAVSAVFLSLKRPAAVPLGSLLGLRNHGSSRMAWELRVGALAAQQGAARRRQRRRLVKKAACLSLRLLLLASPIRCPQIQSHTRILSRSAQLCCLQADPSTLVPAASLT